MKFALYIFMNTYKDISDKDLLDLLVKYTDQYTHMLKGDKDLFTVRQVINEIINEFKVRKEVPGSLSSPIR